MTSRTALFAEPSGHYLTLRPLKFAMLVEPRDRDALLEAIRINTFLWGGTYNPIIPIFSNTPENWSDRPLPLPSPAEILSGYIRFFDPDIPVACGKINPAKIETKDGRLCRRATLPSRSVSTEFRGTASAFLRFWPNSAAK